MSSEFLVAQGDTLRGASAGTVLKASADFQGRAVVVLESGSSIERVTIDGNRDLLSKRMPIAPSDRTFASFYRNNGILTAGTQRVGIRNVQLKNIPNFAVLVSSASDVLLDRVQVFDSGSLNANGRNNTSGGILLEEGSTDFSVRNCELQNVSGNGVWTHSLYTSPRNARGRITANRFRNIGRDAIQVGHATQVEVRHNTGSRIGYPHAVVDMEGGGMPVAIDTAGNVDRSVYEKNRFTEINGKCIDLDGFHHGDVVRNSCRNRFPASHYPYGHFGIVFNNTNPDMESEAVRVIGNRISGTKFGGIFVIGRGHTIQGNQLLRLNLAGCNESHAKYGCIYNAEEPDILQTGIYLGRRAERPGIARDNTVKGNLVTGFKMANRCVATAPGVDPNGNTVEENTCLNR